VEALFVDTLLKVVTSLLLRRLIFYDERLDLKVGSKFLLKTRIKYCLGFVDALFVDSLRVGYNS
jgi:hypothetical protein